MEKIILLGHGSPRQSANTLGEVAALLHARLHPGCTSAGCVETAYMEFAKPSIPEAIEAAIEAGAGTLVLHPFFLNAGVHVTKDIPGIIDEARARHPQVRFIYTEPLGIHEKLIDVVVERMREAGFERPEDIEDRSMEIIEEEFDLSSFSEEARPVVKRAIHATADYEFGLSMRLHPEAIERGIELLRAGKGILTDVEMVRAGIDRRRAAALGARVDCSIGSQEVIALAEESGDTRAATAMLKSYVPGETGVIAIGNAPTALFKAMELVEKTVPEERPLIVGLPVGFVKALEAKSMLAASGYPHITNLGRKGGSTAAVAVVNALLRLALKG